MNMLNVLCQEIGKTFFSLGDNLFLFCFRDYIDRGLKNVEEELARGGISSTTVQQSSTAQYTMNTQARTGSVLQDNNTQPTHLVFLERLKK